MSSRKVGPTAVSTLAATPPDSVLPSGWTKVGKKVTVALPSNWEVRELGSDTMVAGAPTDAGDANLRTLLKSQLTGMASTNWEGVYAIGPGRNGLEGALIATSPVGRIDQLLELVKDREASAKNSLNESSGVSTIDVSSGRFGMFSLTGTDATVGPGLQTRYVVGFGKGGIITLVFLSLSGESGIAKDVLESVRETP